jgi:hypothetical protein
LTVREICTKASSGGDGDVVARRGAGEVGEGAADDLAAIETDGAPAAPCSRSVVRR